MFDELMLHGDTLYAKSGVKSESMFIQLRLPWYRGLPVSCIDRLEFTVDGKLVPRENTHLLLNGVPFTNDELVNLTDTTWFVLDTKEVKLTFDAPPAEGLHDVSLLMHLRIPYYKNVPDPHPETPNYEQFATCSKKMQFKRRDI